MRVARVSSFQELYFMSKGIVAQEEKLHLDTGNIHLLLVLNPTPVLRSPESSHKLESSIGLPRFPCRNSGTTGVDGSVWAAPDWTSIFRIVPLSL